MNPARCIDCTTDVAKDISGREDRARGTRLDPQVRVDEHPRDPARHGQVDDPRRLVPPRPPSAPRAGTGAALSAWGAPLATASPARA